MSCERCGHWWTPDKRDWRNPPEKGWCTLNPVWLETRSKHFCGQQPVAYKTQSEKERSDNHYHWTHRRMIEEQTRAIAAEKKLKEIRKKYRELKVLATAKALAED
jgi:hypothetical protein